MNVTIATRSGRNSKNENAIDSESISKPVPDTAKPEGARKAGKKAKPAKKAARAKKAGAKPKTDRANKKAEVIEMMKRAKGNIARNHKSHRLAAAHRARLRRHPEQQGTGEDRVVQERRG
jgi:hypothetical protein